jgi:hypothetical protein
VARNVILFVGDGMGLATITASRILRGQREGRPGEETRLAWEHFPAVALARVSAMFIFIAGCSNDVTNKMKPGWLSRYIDGL